SQSTEKTQALGDEDPLDGSGDSGANADFAAFLNLQDVHGDTALNIAARTGDRAMVRMLLNAGASPTIQNRVGLCPLDFGVEQIAQTGDDSDLWEGDLAGVPDVAMSPTPSGRTRALLPQTPLRSAVRGANKNLLSSLMASCSAQSPMQGRGSGHDGASGLPGDLWSPVSAEQRVHQSVAKIQRLMADLESDFAGEIKTKQAHFDEIKQQLRNTTIELARARETIHKLHSKASQLSEIKLRVGYLEETLGRETSAVREAIAGLPADSKPRQDLEALLATLLGGTAPNGVPQDGDVDVELPRIPGNALDPQPEDDAAAADAEQDPAKLFAMVERLRIVNQVYARRDALLRERVAVLRQRADLSHSERQFRQVIASCCDMSEADVDLWIDKFVAALESGGPSDGEEPQPAAAPGASSLSM
ncbi:transcriptional regulator swi6, partial [Coemansia helicoidea]